jgi:hypothetical protein
MTEEETERVRARKENKKRTGKNSMLLVLFPLSRRDNVGQFDGRRSCVGCKHDLEQLFSRLSSWSGRVKNSSQ